jgi:methyl-accepting chemotaxis protein
MKLFNKLGIRQKFQIILGISFFLVGLFLFFYFPLKQKSEMTRSLHEKANAIAQMVGKTSSAGLIFDEASSVTTLLEAFKSMNDVEFAIVLKKDGKKFAVYNENGYNQFSARVSDAVSNNLTSFSDDDIAMEIYPILSNNEKEGTVVIGMSMVNVDSVVSSGRISAFIVSLLIFLLGLGTMRVFFTKVISKPIDKVLEMAKEMQKGHIKARANVDSHDEIGTMAKILDQFAAQVDESIVGAMKQIVEGNVTFDAPSYDAQDEIAPVINKMTLTIREMINESKILVDAAVSGNLKVRGDADKFKGGFREIIQGMNGTFDAVVKPIEESGKVLEIIANGDLTVRMNGDYKGDFAIIKNSINKLVSSFDQALTDVSSSVQATASASNEITSSAEEMAAGAQEQSTQTSEVASAVEEMTRTILETTKNSSIAAEAAKNAGAIAKEGGKVVLQTIEGMNRISEVVSKSAATVQALGKSSDQIGEIVQVIDDIADQTNLLALNAAIEAARAGEQGRGFAVVADEVRKLAERTTKATKEIASMIKQIQKDTNGAVASMEEGTNEVVKGKHLADKAGESLQEIITGADKVVDVITQVAAASEEQSSASEEISKNVEAISNVTHESAAGVQQIARAAEDLSRLTINLQELVSKFKIDSHAASTSDRSNQQISQTKIVHRIERNTGRK